MKHLVHLEDVAVLSKKEPLYEMANFSAKRILRIKNQKSG